jgi:hypothetical protein
MGAGSSHKCIVLFQCAMAVQVHIFGKKILLSCSHGTLDNETHY